MVGVTIDSGELPSAVGVEGDALMRVITMWQRISSWRFPEDCEALLQMVDETDRLRLWEKNIGGFTFKDRNEFLQKRVLIDFKLTEQALKEILDRLHRGEKATMQATHNRELDAATPDLKEVGHPNSRDEKNDTRIGTSDTAEYAIAKLRKDAPAIHQRVLAGELTPHAGMIEAGFRNKRASRKLSALDQLRRWWNKASEEERAKFRDEIGTV